MKYITTVVEIETTIKLHGQTADHTPGVVKEYKIITMDGKRVRIPINQIIHNNSFIAYQKYAARRYETDLDRVYRDKIVTVQIRIKSPILPKWLPFKSSIEELYTSYDLVPYWTGNCYNRLVTHIVYTKEQFLKGEQFSKDTEFGDSIHLHGLHSGCDKNYIGICIASAGLCTDFTTGNLDEIIRRARGENWCDWAMRRFEDKYGYNPRTSTPSTIYSDTDSFRSSMM